MKPSLVALTLGSLFLAPSPPILRGGWAVITVEDLPEYAVAGRSFDLVFTVRQHGYTRLAGLRPTVEIGNGRSISRVAATAGRETGQYTAAVVAPRAGTWVITIHSGFGNSSTTLPPLPAIQAGAATPVALADAERGRRLFVAKGCVSCHVHRELGTRPVGEIGPELTDRRFVVALLRQFLANPARTGTAKDMPNLGLQAVEIEGLMAFLNPRPLALR